MMRVATLSTIELQKKMVVELFYLKTCCCCVHLDFKLYVVSALIPFEQKLKHQDPF